VEEEEEVIEKEEGLEMDGMRRGHELRRMALPTLLDITDKQDTMNISALMSQRPTRFKDVINSNRLPFSHPLAVI
jgi:hypothetical protein